MEQQLGGMEINQPQILTPCARGKRQSRQASQEGGKGQGHGEHCKCKAHAAPFLSQLPHRKLGLVPKPPSQWSASLCALTARAWKQCRLRAMSRWFFLKQNVLGHR